MFFYALTSAGPWGRCWTPHPPSRAWGFNDPEGSSRCKCIRKTCLIVIIANSHFVTWELQKNISKSSFQYYYNGAQKHEGFVGFENACTRAKTYVILTSLNYVNFFAPYCWWCWFMWWHRMRICKVQKLCINSMWIAWLIYGFLPVKAWLLHVIACNTAFYAII